MGKGKGAKVRLYTAFNGSAVLAAVSTLRSGLRVRLGRFMGIRLGRPVLVYSKSNSFKCPSWVQRHRTQAGSIKNRAKEVRSLLQLARRPSLKVFFSRLFYTA
jgi:hypothetical protein